MIQTLDMIDDHKVKLQCTFNRQLFSKRELNKLILPGFAMYQNKLLIPISRLIMSNLLLLVDDGNILIMKSKHIASKAQDNIITVLDQAPEKKDLFALNAVSGTHIDKYRLLSDKSTSNVSIDQIRTNRVELDARMAALQTRINKAKGVSE